VIPPRAARRLGAEAGLRPGLTLRALVPNAITAGALCVGLTGIRFAIAGDFAKAVQAVIVAGVLDGIDGRMARALRAETRFGAELDSLADSISFGVAPALIVYLWSLQSLPRVGWFAALAFAICCVLRLARFNARIDMPEQPHKEAGFLTGVPAPLGAALAFLPLYIWLSSGLEVFRMPLLVGAWMVLVAFLMISAVPTLGWSRIRPRRNVRIEVIALLGLLVAALLSEPWLTLAGVTIIYLLSMPYTFVVYGRVKQQREARLGSRSAPGAGPSAEPHSPE
jgi:CDP-diacylglycerol--serine O-phosphatidyltransferase